MLSLRHPRLLWLGLLRFAVILVLTVLFSGLILLNHDAIMSRLWQMPASGFPVYLWHLASWLLSLLLAAFSVVIAYLTAQVCFNVFIMDYMSRITEKIVLGKEMSVSDRGWFKTAGYLIVQEIPRAVIPMIITLVVMTAGFLPAGSGDPGGVCSHSRRVSGLGQHRPGAGPADAAFQRPVAVSASARGISYRVRTAADHSLAQYPDALVCPGGATLYHLHNHEKDFYERSGDRRCRFIGYSLSARLLDSGHTVVGIDNLNDYYDVTLKQARLSRLEKKTGFLFQKLDLADRPGMEALFQKNAFDCVVNLAAQAGVRHSIDNPSSYVDSNLVGFGNVLEGCRHSQVRHLVYASSSSVYGLNTLMPFSVHQNVDHPISLYAASKKANELMAHTYSYLYNLPCTGLRFFTVYGPGAVRTWPCFCSPKR